MDRLRNDDGTFKARTYKVTVWNNTNGDMELYEDEAAEARVDEIKDIFDEPIYSVEVEDNN